MGQDILIYKQLVSKNAVLLQVNGSLLAYRKVTNNLFATK